MNLLTILPKVKIPMAIMIAAALLLALTGGVWAAKGAVSGDSIGSGGILHGCYVPHKNANETQGKLRLVSDPENCKRSEVLISWDGAITDSDTSDPDSDPTPTSASVVELRGPVTGFTSGTTGTVTEIVFPIGLAEGEDPVDLTQGTAKVEYVDLSPQSITSTTPSRFQTIPVTGADSDLVLEAHEIFEIRFSTWTDSWRPIWARARVLR